MERRGSTILYSVSEYTGTGPNPREGTITVNEVDFTVRQALGGCTYAFNPITLPSVSPDGAVNAEVNLDTAIGCSWDTNIPGGPSWLRINFGTSGNIGGKIIYTVDPNPNKTSRSADIVITQDTAVCLTITQDPALNSAPIAANDTDFAHINETITIDVLNNDNDPDPTDTLTISNPGTHPDAVIDKNASEQITFSSSFSNGDTITL